MVECRAYLDRSIAAALPGPWHSQGADLPVDDGLQPRLPRLRGDGAQGAHEVGIHLLLRLLALPQARQAHTNIDGSCLVSSLTMLSIRQNLPVSAQYTPLDHLRRLCGPGECMSH